MATEIFHSKPVRDQIPEILDERGAGHPAHEWAGFMASG